METLACNIIWDLVQPQNSRERDFVEGRKAEVLLFVKEQPAGKILSPDWVAQLVKDKTSLFCKDVLKNITTVNMTDTSVMVDWLISFVWCLYYVSCRPCYEQDTIWSSGQRGKESRTLKYGKLKFMSNILLKNLDSCQNKKKLSPYLAVSMNPFTGYQFPRVRSCSAK